MKPAISPFFLIFMFLVLSFIARPNLVYADELAVSTSEPSYILGATVRVYGMLTLNRNPVADGLVSIEVDDRLGRPSFIRVVSTGTFPPPWKIRIVEFYLCDSWGNPKDSFNRGAPLYLCATVESLDTIFERQVTLAFNLQDSVGFSAAIAYASFSLAPGKQFTYFASMSIPSDAFGGSAIVCASVLTNWPKNGGYPYCPGESVELEIIGEPSKDSPPSSPTGFAGYYSVSFKLPGDAELGYYRVVTSARHNAWASTTFDYFWRQTDINRDGRVNILDISSAAIAFGSIAGDSNYNDSVDLNEDNVINILDISSIAIDYGKARV